VKHTRTTNIRRPIISATVAAIAAVQGSFSKKEIWEQNSGGSRISKLVTRRLRRDEFERRSREDQGRVWEGGVSFLLGKGLGKGCASSTEKISILDLK